MRGDIDATTFRCLLGDGRSLQAYCATRDVAMAYFMVRSSIDRSLGRQWPPIKAALECRTTPFLTIDVRVFATIRLLWRCFFHDPPTFRCSLFRGIGQLTSVLTWRWLLLLGA
mgnify:CR=1 FL=1